VRALTILLATLVLACLLCLAVVFWFASMGRISGHRPVAEETWEWTVDSMGQAAVLDEDLVVWSGALVLGWSVAVFLVGSLGNAPLRVKLRLLALGVAYAFVAVIVGGFSRHSFSGSGAKAFHLAYSVFVIALYAALFARKQAAVLRAFWQRDTESGRR